MRTRKKKWTARELVLNPLIIKDKTTYPGRFPVHLEIGCGKGQFITQTAAVNPTICYIAVERDPTIMAAAARLANEMQLSNVYFFEFDVKNAAEYFNSGDIGRLYINFCDPWPRKKKWAKRRLTHENFLQLYEQLQIPEIHFKTDNQMLFEFSIESFSKRGWRLKNISLNLHNSGMEGNIKTEYEEKFSNQGMPIYRLEAFAPVSHTIQYSDL